MKILNKREEKGCKGKEDVEINVQCAESIQLHVNNERPTKKTPGVIKKNLEIIEQKNEVETTSPNKKGKGQSTKRNERSNIDFHCALIENLSLLWRINKLKPFRGFLELAFWSYKVFFYYQIMKGLIVHIFDSALESVAFGIVFGHSWDKFCGDLILEASYTIMLSLMFQGRAKLQYPNHNEDPTHVRMKDAKGSLIMWRKENMKLVWIFQYFGLGLTNNGLWEYFTCLGCRCFPITTKHMIECFLFDQYPTIAKHIWRMKPFVSRYACTCLSLCMHCVGTNLSY